MGRYKKLEILALKTRRRFCAPLIQSVAEKLKSMSAAVMMERMAIKVLDEWAAAGYPVPDRDFSTEESMRVASL
jgi:hypothetical protein